MTGSRTLSVSRAQRAHGGHRGSFRGGLMAFPQVASCVAGPDRVFLKTARGGDTPPGFESLALRKTPGNGHLTCGTAASR